MWAEVRGSLRAVPSNTSLVSFPHNFLITQGTRVGAVTEEVVEKTKDALCHLAYSISPPILFHSLFFSQSQASAVASCGIPFILLFPNTKYLNFIGYVSLTIPHQSLYMENNPRMKGSRIYGLPSSSGRKEYNKLFLLNMTLIFFLTKSILIYAHILL
jgi:hypothetical protein